MVASFITRIVIIMLGYLYPAFECFKSVEKNRPDVNQLCFWCQYWIIIAVLSVMERLGDTFISWLPMYCEAKLAFIVYLWHPKTKGTSYVYSAFLKPFVANHEPEIDRQLHELRTRSGDLALHFCQRSSVYAQSKLMDILQYVASQAPPATHHQAGSAPPTPCDPQQAPSNYYAPPPPVMLGYQQLPLMYAQEVHSGLHQPPAASRQPLPTPAYQPLPTPAYQPLPPSAYPSHQLNPNLAYEPSAPVLPTGYPISQPEVMSAHYPELPGMIQEPNSVHNVPEFEITDNMEHARVTQPVASVPVQRTKSRQRARKQQ